jgi:hypothetical protein
MGVCLGPMGVLQVIPSSRPSMWQLEQATPSLEMRTSSVR